MVDYYKNPPMLLKDYLARVGFYTASRSIRTMQDWKFLRTNVVGERIEILLVSLPQRVNMGVSFLVL